MVCSLKAAKTRMTKSRLRTSYYITDKRSVLSEKNSATSLFFSTIRTAATLAITRDRERMAQAIRSTSQIKSPLPPCGGGSGWGVLGEAPVSKKSIDRVKALDPPPCSSPTRGEEIRTSVADCSVRWAKRIKHQFTLSGDPHSNHCFHQPRFALPVPGRPHRGRLQANYTRRSTPGRNNKNVSPASRPRNSGDHPPDGTTMPGMKTAVSPADLLLAR